MNEIVTLYNDLESKILLTESVPVPMPIDSETKHIVESLMMTLKKQGWGGGLAAPQIGFNRRVMICSYSRQIEDVEVIINPTYYPNDNICEEGWEGCFSIPLTMARIVRWQNIKVSYFNLLGQKIIKNLVKNPARIFQHEYDHLEGEVMINKSQIVKTFRSKEEYQKFLRQSL